MIPGIKKSVFSNYALPKLFKKHAQEFHTYMPIALKIYVIGTFFKKIKIIKSEPTGIKNRIDHKRYFL